MAEVAAGLLASPFVKLAVGKLGSAVREQANLLWSFSGDLEDMKDTMESISAALKDAERRSVAEESVRLWLKRLKSAALDICDMLDSYHQEASGQATAKTPRMLSWIPSARNKNALANKMKNMRAELRKINEQFWSFQFTKSTSDTIGHQHYDQRETTSDVVGEQIIGRDNEKQTIINLLSASENNDETMILPIYGLGGMGKTSLAQLVYNNTQFKNYHHRIWVYVSQNFNLIKIGSKIISQLQIGAQQNTDSLQVINRCLDDLLHGKKVLIVLDDLWQEEDSELNKLKNMLQLGKKGYTTDVIVTTRKKDIANKICTKQPFELLPLSHDICWDIIKKYSQFEDRTYKEQLLHIGFDIAKKCGGVALAAQAIGCMLKSKDLSEWLEVNNSDIWNESSSTEKNLPLPSLKLSYECMPPDLKVCFAYCAIFPKGHDIVQDYLIYQWMALDFIKPSKRIGEEYINQLLGMSFLEQSKNALNSTKHVAHYTSTKRNPMHYTMHDLVHDLARSIIGDELSVSCDAPHDKKYCRYALLAKYEQPSKLSDILPSKLRVVLFLDSSNLYLAHGAFSFAKYLRILDFNECSSVLLPTTIGQLKLLKFLNAPRVQNEAFPKCITELPKLQYLNLKGSSRISVLPESIGKLGCLIYLDLSSLSSLSELPESFGDLKFLVHLDMSCCFQIGELPRSLGNLTSLQHLDLSHCCSVEVIPESVSGLTQLQHLNLSYCFNLARLPQAIGSLVNLRYLNMSGCEEMRELPESFKKLQNLLYLDLADCNIIEDLPGSLCGLTALQHLDLSGHGMDVLFATGDLPDVLVNLTNLEYLSLRKGVSWSDDRKEFSNRYVDFISTLTNLEYLDLSGSLSGKHTLHLQYDRDLKPLPESIGKIKLRSLLMDECPDELIAQVCSRAHYTLTCLRFSVVGAGDVSGCSNLHLLEGLNVGELGIRHLEKVRFLEEACKVRMLDKQNLSKLSLAWTSGGDRLLEDKDLLEQLLPPTSLKELTLEGYSSASFPSWVTCGISQHLPNVVQISLINLPTCSSLPSLGQLPSLEVLQLSRLLSITKIDKNFCGGKGAFRRLLRLSICYMYILEEWSTTYATEDGEEFMFPVLEELWVDGCPKLKLKPCPPKFHTCRIWDSDQVISSLEELENTSQHSSAAAVCLSGISTFCQSSRLFHHFPALQELIVSDCCKLTSLPESMRSLTSLQSLELSSCDSMSALPEWLSDLSYLESLSIKKCPGIKILPSCIQKLSQLWKLEIWENPELKRWCELEENKTKLSHINNIYFYQCDG